jgi:hypothetical protein
MRIMMGDFAGDSASSPRTGLRALIRPTYAAGRRPDWPSAERPLIGNSGKRWPGALRQSALPDMAIPDDGEMTCEGVVATIKQGLQ